MTVTLFIPCFIDVLYPKVGLSVVTILERLGLRVVCPEAVACCGHRVTFHDGCHGLRELKVKRPPRELLGRVRGLELVELAQAEVCCGFGGTFSTKFSAISSAMGEMKCAGAVEARTDYIVSNDSSCLMHLQGLASRQDLPVKTIHLAEILAGSIKF